MPGTVVLVSSLATMRPAAAQGVPAVLRGHALEIVDDQGRGARQHQRDSGGTSAKGDRYPETVLLRLITERGRPSVKISCLGGGGRAWVFAGPTGTEAPYVILESKGTCQLVEAQERRWPGADGQALAGRRRGQHSRISFARTPDGSIGLDRPPPYAARSRISTADDGSGGGDWSIMDPDLDDLVDDVTDIDLPSGLRRERGRATRSNWVLIGIVLVLAVVVYLLFW